MGYPYTDGEIALEPLLNGPLAEVDGLKKNLRVVDFSKLVPYGHDYIALSYTGTDLTGVVYKSGGALGTTVATLTLVYIANVLQSVTKT